MNISGLPLVVVDTETTGPNVYEHEILSYAFVPLDGSSSLSGYVDVGESKWSDYARANFQGFSDVWHREALDPSAAVKEIEEYIISVLGNNQIVIVGHNVGFDRSFLLKLANQAGISGIPGISHRSVDTHSILAFLHLRGLIPADALSSDGAFSYFGIEVAKSERHTALGDAKATATLFKKLLDLTAHANTCLSLTV